MRGGDLTFNNGVYFLHFVIIVLDKLNKAGEDRM